MRPNRARRFSSQVFFFSNFIPFFLLITPHAGFSLDVYTFQTHIDLYLVLLSCALA